MTDRKYDAILIKTLDDVETPSMKFYDIEIKDLVNKETGEITRMMSFNCSFKFRNKIFKKYITNTYLHIFDITNDLHSIKYNNLYDYIAQAIFTNDYNVLNKMSKKAKKFLLSGYGIV